MIKVVHRGHLATERQVGHIYDGWRVISIRRASKLEQLRYRGKTWTFIGEKVDGVTTMGNTLRPWLP